VAGSSVLLLGAGPSSVLASPLQECLESPIIPGMVSLSSLLFSALIASDLMAQFPIQPGWCSW
jgi:Asp/Glu/hydantoin racemase